MTQFKKWSNSKPLVDLTRHTIILFCQDSTYVLRMYTHVRTSSSSLGSLCVPWLGEGLSMLSPNDPVLCCPLPCHVAPVFVQVVSPPLGWSPSGNTWGPSVVCGWYDLLRTISFFSQCWIIVDYIYDFCPLPDPDVGFSIFVCVVEHTSFHFGMCGCEFVLCLFGQCPGLCTIMS